MHQLAAERRSRELEAEESDETALDKKKQAKPKAIQSSKIAPARPRTEQKGEANKPPRPELVTAFKPAEKKPEPARQAVTKLENSAAAKPPIEKAIIVPERLQSQVYRWETPISLAPKPELASTLKTETPKLEDEIADSPTAEIALYDTKTAEIIASIELTNEWLAGDQPITVVEQFGEQLEEDWSAMLSLAITEAQAEIFGEQFVIPEMESTIAGAQTEVFGRQFTLQESDFAEGELILDAVDQPEIAKHENSSELEIVLEPLPAMLEALPEPIQAKLVEYLPTIEAGAAAAIEEQLVSIAVAADRLHELVVTDRADSEEAIQIEALITEWCEQLYVELGVAVDEEQLKQFIAAIKAIDYGHQVVEELELAREDEGTRERKLGIFTLPQNLSDARQRLQAKLGVLIVQMVTVAGLEPTML